MILKASRNLGGLALALSVNWFSHDQDSHCTLRSRGWLRNFFTEASLVC